MAKSKKRVVRKEVPKKSPKIELIKPQKYFDQEVAETAQKQTPKISAFSAFLIIIVILGFIILISRIIINSADVLEEVVENPVEVVVPVEIVEEIQAPESNDPVPADFAPIEGEETCFEVTADYKVTCNSVYGKYACSNLVDGNLSTEWLAAYSCGSAAVPCAVNNWIRFEKVNPSAPDIAKILFYNRVHQDYYVNRAILNYDGLKQTVIGGKFLVPWVIDLNQPSGNVTMNIVEIVGLGSNYLAGSAEVKLFGKC
jgi:hypothetical protein